MGLNCCNGIDGTISAAGWESVIDLEGGNGVKPIEKAIEYKLSKYYFTPTVTAVVGVVLGSILVVNTIFNKEISPEGWYILLVATCTPFVYNARSRVTKVSREEKEFVFTHGFGSTTRIPIHSLNAVGHQRKKGWFQCFFPDLDGSTDCSGYSTSVALTTKDASECCSQQNNSVVLDLDDHEKFLADNFEALEGQKPVVATQPSQVAPQDFAN
jgi:hypothetical protein